MARGRFGGEGPGLGQGPQRRIRQGTGRSKRVRGPEGRSAEILDSKERIPFIYKHGPHYYNFWKDAKNPQGLWRRTTLEEYRKPEPKWDVLLDLDALNKAEKENWVWKGSSILKAGGWRHVLVNLSRGGADATVVREYDLETRSFVKGGFELPESKGELSWIDKDSVYVGTDFGPGTMTSSGYPRIAKLWKRGTPLSSAQVVFEGRPNDVDRRRGLRRYQGLRAASDLPRARLLQERALPEGQGRETAKVEVPEDAKASAHREWSDHRAPDCLDRGGKTYAAGSLLAAKFDDYMAGKREFTVLFEPTLRILPGGPQLDAPSPDPQRSRGREEHPLGPDAWKGRLDPHDSARCPGFATVGAGGVDAEENDDFFMTTSGYLTPTTLLHGTHRADPHEVEGAARLLRRRGP